MLIYVAQHTPRLKYVFKLIFKEILSIDYILTADKAAFIHSLLPKLSYGKQPIADEVFFYSENLLFETQIHNLELLTGAFEGINVLFPNYHRASALPFDPFAAAFFLVSRYEEYLPHHRDEHNRYHPHESVAYKNGFLQKPVVNIYCQMLKMAILNKYPEYKFPELSFKSIITIDIDLAYAYLYKGLLRNIGGFAKLIKQGDFKEVIRRIKIMLKWQPDPFDTYQYQLSMIKQHQLTCIYFILLADYDVFDKNIRYNNKHFQSLIKYLADYADIGIHLSYASNKKFEKISKEIGRLKSITHKNISKNRQHFLMLQLPDTYQRLINCEIYDDFTMGYAQEPGFRAGIASPFYFYNLNIEYETPLKLHPFAFMDGTFVDYMKLNTVQATELMKRLIIEVKNVNGTLYSLWHNQTFSETNEWIGWRNVFEQFISDTL